MPSSVQPAVVHVDLDGAADIYEAHGWPYQAGSDPLFESGLRRALDFFAAAHIRATLFAIGRHLDDPRKRDLLKEAVRQGHEIASHTITHRHLDRLTSQEKRREISESRDSLSDSLGVEVEGFRAPGFRIDRESFELIGQAGYTYDSSVFPSAKFARRTGLPRLNNFPHQPIASGKLMELPLPSASPLPFPFHPCFSLVLGMRYFRGALNRFSRQGVPLVFLFHLTDFADPLPEHLTRPLGRRLYTLSYLPAEKKLTQCRRMLHFVRERFRVVTTTELLERAVLQANSV